MFVHIDGCNAVGRYLASIKSLVAIADKRPTKKPRHQSDRGGNGDDTELHDGVQYIFLMLGAILYLTSWQCKILLARNVQGDFPVLVVAARLALERVGQV
ncbi:hypothetical protein PV325_001438 [Microctonus aethiopoides]|nr:hypothetical protein PV325_001438 [Microctonus aethiopoides]